MAIYNMPDYSNIHKAHRIKETRGASPNEVQYELVICSLGPDNIDFVMKLFM